MAIRKVSDLEKLEILEIFRTPLSSTVDDMLIEVSYPTEVAGKTYQSRKTMFRDMATAINASILCSNTLVDFWDTVIFHNEISALCGLCLTGNFYVNKDCPDSILNQYETVMRTGNTTIFSMLTNLLSSNDTNILAAPNNIICSDTQVLALFSDIETTLSSGTGGSQLKLIYPNIQIGTGTTSTTINGDLTVTGPATFTQVINGCALCAKWADLAEIYEADEDYSPGTLVKFGGDAELTIADTIANAVITTQPGLVLGQTSETKPLGKGIALIGRVPVKCVGEVKKFDQMVLSETPGFARSNHEESNGKKQVIGIALEDSSNELSSLVECTVKLAF